MLRHLDRWNSEVFSTRQTVAQHCNGFYWNPKEPNVTPKTGSQSPRSAFELRRFRCENDSLAWNQLVELYGPLVFHRCSVSRIQSCDAADIMREVFASAVKSIHRFDSRPGHSVHGWLWTITATRCATIGAIVAVNIDRNWLLERTDDGKSQSYTVQAVSYTHLRAHETLRFDVLGWIKE